MNILEIKNMLAKIVIVCWIATLICVAGYVARFSISFDINGTFRLGDTDKLPISVVHEGKLILLMFAVAIIGGVSFMIKDFYRSVKYANIYTTLYSDYRSGNISAAEFGRMVTIEIYTGRFNHTWIFWFLIQPILSSTLGVIAFFIARSGLGVLQGAAMSGDISIQSVYLYAVLTYLAGFSSHKFIAWLDRLADKIFSTTLPEKQASVKAEIVETASQDQENLKKEVISISSAEKTDTISVLPEVNSESPVAESIASEEIPMKSIR